MRGETLRILFCSSPLDQMTVDLDYHNEYMAAINVGLDVSLISYEDLCVLGDGKKAVKRIPASESGEIAIYRGWMMKPSDYKTLYYVLKEKGVMLINDAAAYLHCHYLPESYSVVEEFTPKTVSVKIEGEPDFDVIMKSLEVFSDTPVILKDFVKSQKHHWEEACYIPHANNRDEVERVAKRFLQLQGEDLNEGLVFRQFIKLEFLKAHSKSGMPLTKEFRTFFLYGKPLSIFPYWDEGDYGEAVPDLTPFIDVAKKVKSNFFTMDIAKIEDGAWAIIELGDGQVSGLPDNANVKEFCNRLKERLINGA